MARLGEREGGRWGRGESARCAVGEEMVEDWARYGMKAEAGDAAAWTGEAAV